MGINSSKVYCKWKYEIYFSPPFLYVLIVAKCIVNINIYNEGIEDYEVLIVAKCIVNIEVFSEVGKFIKVLIVAKCIVNSKKINCIIRYNMY